MNIIRILPEQVASQIAAGEVIDRPASVLRELIDNSIDASADRIVITVENGGKRLIKVIDNGTGMSRDDLLLSVERHATSKIENASDLFSIKSLGFRGEALPSIASVSRMKITSRPKDKLTGHRLKINGGKLIEIEETGSPAGTIIEAKGLFFNVPARQKFLRTSQTELNYIIDSFFRTALGFPGINFKLDDSAKNIINLPASKEHLSRLSALMGLKVVESMKQGNEQFPDMSVNSYLAPPEFSRTKGDRLFIYVNGRNIRDRLVTRAVIEGYGKRLMKGQYPQAVVFIEIDPSKVDVNVHPAKQEVRFHEGPAVFKAIASTIEKAFSNSFNTFPGNSPKRYEKLESMEKSFESVSEPGLMYFPTPENTTGRFETHKNENLVFTDNSKIIGQLGNTYILCQVKNGLLMVDQHAAHERIVYENLKKSLGSAVIEAQNLLIPFELEMTEKEKRIVLEKGERLSDFGIELSHFGGNTFLLRSVPAILKNVKWDSFISELIAELDEGKLQDDTVLDRVLTVIACHGAIRAGYIMSHEEMTNLISDLNSTDLPTNCPHGRPTFKEFSYAEIEKIFKRTL
ncbi:MAG TPA: DNA mismatch repair endonuclease MutL [Desulfobacteraceae bacterium]|nr:DNA mismatch repair endonuclease MutL [Desulfobacteraceae bacterium]HPJ67883.1 DNA mismatch repair endonuclease MutL [Desulfobacteraceae bacterium]HPQ29979.1 DNA mismatch repair endonuclease MutL [Desulfobacteraceae bacterium]